LKTSYRVEVSATAEKQIKNLQRDDQERVLRAIVLLAHDPRPQGCRKLKGYENTYRIRLGVFRIIYCIDDERLMVVIIKVGHRKHVYR